MYETSLDPALVGVPIPLHPGALRYFQEVGLLGPDANLEVALAENVRRAGSAAYESSGALRATVSTIAATPEASPKPATWSAAPAPGLADDNNGKTFVVYFGLNEKQVSGDGIQELAEVSAYADNLANASIQISGHADRSGDPAYNSYLAEIRANAVMNVLQDTFGVAGHELSVETYGASAPAIDDGREYQPQNRRVEIRVTPKTTATSEQAQQAITPEVGPGEDSDLRDVPTWKKRASI
jgi:outer membrane protein OmpA-like peptidoglycan-associated protein